MSRSIWMDETTPEEFRAEYPHLPCGSEEPHEGHGWRGTRREFGGAAEVTRTFYCPGGAETDPACPLVDDPDLSQVSEPPPLSAYPHMMQPTPPQEAE